MRYSSEIVKILLLVLLVGIFFIGCSPKPIESNTFLDTVEIVDTYSKASYSLPTYIGKSIILMTYPATYEVTVEYYGTQFRFEGKVLYDKYKDQIGTKIKAKIQEDIYSDGTVIYRVVEIE